MREICLNDNIFTQDEEKRENIKNIIKNNISRTVKMYIDKSKEEYLEDEKKKLISELKYMRKPLMFIYNPFPSIQI